MGLIEVIEKEPIREAIDKVPMIYSPKLGIFIPLEKPKGDMQKDNLGMAPGSWY